MQAVTSPFPVVVTCLSAPSDFLTRSRRFRRGDSPDIRKNPHPSVPAQSCGAADVPATHAQITGRWTPDLGHCCARHVVVRVEPSRRTRGRRFLARTGHGHGGARDSALCHH
jgi:hypothetical protein